MGRKSRGGRKQQYVIVMRAEDAGNGEKSIAARSIFNDDRLAPFRRKFVGNQSCGDINARTRSEWNEQDAAAIAGLMIVPAQEARRRWMKDKISP
jgi:hypothetical protein